MQTDGVEGDDVTHNAKTIQGIPHKLNPDGIVIKVNDFEKRKAIGGTSIGPKWQVAYKIEKYEGQTTLQEVDWQVGKTGVLTPVGRLAPVPELQGQGTRR